MNYLAHPRVKIRTMIKLTAKKKLIEYKLKDQSKLLLTDQLLKSEDGDNAKLLVKTLQFEAIVQRARLTKSKVIYELGFIFMAVTKF